MNREIIFKAKVKDWEQKPKDKQWVYGYYVRGFDIYEKPIHIIFDTTTIFYSRGETDGWDEIDANTLCRYTGLTDKNGKKIWENDFLRYRHNFCKVRWDDNFSRFVVDEYTKYNGEYVALDIHGFNCFKENTGKFFEVIGNVFDNPELLKEGAEDE